MELKERIDRIILELDTRTAWGVTLDVIELSLAKKEAEYSINLIDDALRYIEKFSRTNIPDPKIEVVE